MTSSGAAYGYHADNPAWLDRRRRRCAATRRSPIRTTSGWSRKCWPTYRARAPGAAAGRIARRHDPRRNDAQPDHGAVREAAPARDARLATAPSCSSGTETSSAPSSMRSVTDAEGIYNVAGDGALEHPGDRRRLGKRCLTLPPALLRAVLAVLHPLRPDAATARSRSTSCAIARCSKSPPQERTGLRASHDFDRGVRFLLPHARPRPGPRRMRRRHFTGATVVISGAASGLGRALALRFAAAGARPVLLDRDVAALHRDCRRA